MTNKKIELIQRLMYIKKDIDYAKFRKENKGGQQVTEYNRWVYASPSLLRDTSREIDFIISLCEEIFPEEAGKIKNNNDYNYL